MMTETAYADRYVAAVARAVPAAARGDVVAELRAAIADQVEPLVAGGATDDDAERAVVAELGEPLAYAAQLIDRPLHLIGPRYFAAWWRLLKLLLVIVPACALGGVLIGDAARGANVGAILGSAISVLIQSVVHVGFWTTLVFVILERTGSSGDTVLEWSPDQLPQATSTSSPRFGDAIATGVLFVLLTGSVVWDRVVGWGGEHVHLLSSGLWPWTIAIGFALLAVGVLIEVIAGVRGRMSAMLSRVGVLASLVASIGAIVLIWQGAVLDPDLMARMRAASTPTTDVVQIVNIVLTVVVVGTLVGVVLGSLRRHDGTDGTRAVRPRPRGIGWRP